MGTATLDYTQPPASVLLAQCNFDNGQGVTPDQVAFTQPATLPDTDASGMNTICLASARPGATACSGSMYLRYNRNPISSVPGSRQTSFAKGAATKLSGLLAQINEAWGQCLSRHDIENVTLPAIAAGGSATVTLQMAGRALLWTGSVDITVTN
ncbi:hypothetical protein [Paraburkholderia sp. BCC1886]|uniref:DUF7941 domain-family protein n=1 Tax=Paraburkholderia sp. BCC1886 TaxID=2562670 RepID=UPI0011846516|nr:hypothetical protein [Paraburkholderia sp. BCC1886]